MKIDYIGEAIHLPLVLVFLCYEIFHKSMKPSEFLFVKSIGFFFQNEKNNSTEKEKKVLLKAEK